MAPTECAGKPRAGWRPWLGWLVAHGASDAWTTREGRVRAGQEAAQPIRTFGWWDAALRVEGQLGARVWGSAGSGRQQGPRASVGMAVCGEGVGRAGRRRGGRPTATVRSCTISGGTRAGLAVLPLGSARPWGPAPNPDGAASALRVQRHPHPLSSDNATANEALFVIVRDRLQKIALWDAR